MIIRVSPIPLTARTAALIENAVRPDRIVTVYPDPKLVQAALTDTDVYALVLEGAPPGVRAMITASCGQVPVFRPVHAQRRDNHGRAISVVSAFTLL